MKLTLNRFFIMIKRSLKQPVNLVMLLVLVTLAIIYQGIPASQKSMYIPVAVLCEDNDPDIQKITESLISRNSIFHFYAVESRDEMYRDISEEKANSGIVIPEGFGAEILNPERDKKILYYTTPGTFLPSLCKDELFNLLFRYISLENLKTLMKNNELYSPDQLPEAISLLSERFDEYMDSSKIFRVEDASGGEYNELTREEKTEIPVAKLAGLFIFAAGMVGIATYLKDKEEKLYLRLVGSQRIVMQCFHIISAILPMTLISIPVILITEGGNVLSVIGRVGLYALACIVYTLIFSLVIRKSTVYQKVLPVVLTLAVLLGGVIFDITQFDRSMKILAMLFPPYFF